MPLKKLLKVSCNASATATEPKPKEASMGVMEIPSVSKKTKPPIAKKNTRVRVINKTRVLPVKEAAKKLEWKNMEIKRSTIQIIVKTMAIFIPGIVARSARTSSGAKGEARKIAVMMSKILTGKFILSTSKSSHITAVDFTYAVILRQNIRRNKKRMIEIVMRAKKKKSQFPPELV